MTKRKNIQRIHTWGDTSS